MVRLREIPRTATFSWSPDAAAPWLATGTKSGAVDVDFSNETCLELWDLALDSPKQGQELKPASTLSTETGFHDLAWTPTEDRGRGIIAGALDSGSLGLWDAENLLQDPSKAEISQERIHSGAIKALQFNPKISNFVATGGAKGELFISDLNHLGSPIRLGSTAARADDIDCLDWNKRVSNILVTGSSGGFVTVWDMKTKKESLTLNNHGRKAVSAIAWDPTNPTRLITAIPLEQEPAILVWDLRNSNAPQSIMRGHDNGVLSLSWCLQDSDLLLSCGKDNRTILWNPQTSHAYGDYPVVTNWTFQTRFNPHNPGLFATASFDGKVQVQTLQNTNPSASESSEQAQATDGEDFFSRAPNQPQASSFSLPKAPKWLERPTSVSFGFGGRLITVRPVDGKSRKSRIDLTKFEVDETVGTATETFEKAITAGSLTALCEERIEGAQSDEEKADWKIIQALVSSNPRSELVKYLGFQDTPADAADSLTKLGLKGDRDEQDRPPVNGVDGKKSHKRFQSIFASSADGDFLSELAATKATKTNNPFHLYSGSESEADKNITRHIIMGRFDKALDIALTEDRMSDAFMIAICGGEKCIKKAQEAYLAKQNAGPNYLRLLAAVVGKNLWDTVHNADLSNWKEVMATLCTFADEKEFHDLCEALGDRLEDQVASNPSSRKDASFCFLAGSKLEKVIGIWIEELKEHEDARDNEINGSSAFSIHARGLQALIEKVTIFRNVVNFKDTELSKSSDWKLQPLYSKYLEYADVVASHGQLDVAQKYLDLLPASYPEADVARTRIAQATRKQPSAAAAATSQTATSTPSKGRASTRPGYIAPENMFSPQAAGQPVASVPPTPFGTSYAPPAQPGSSYAPPTQGNLSFAPSSGPRNPYAPQIAAAQSNPYAPPQQMQAQPLHAQSAPYGIPQASTIAPPPRQYSQSPSIAPPSQAKSMSSWNDLPADFAKPTRSGRATPSAPPVASPFGQHPPTTGIPPPMAPPIGRAQRASPIPPPPKAGAGPPRVTSPLAGQQSSVYQQERPPSSNNAYAPSVSSPPIGQNIMTPPIARGPSPFAPPPSNAPPPSRYAPAPGSTPSQPAASQARPNIAPPPQGSSFQNPPAAANPYAPSQPTQQGRQNLYGNMQTPSPTLSSALPPPPQNQFSSGPPQNAPPQQQQPPPERPSTATSEKRSAPPAKKYPKGDRTHIPQSAQPIYAILSSEMERVKARAPATFKAQVADTEKRLEILYDHLNNEDLIKPDTVQQLVELSQAMQSKDFNRAQEIQMEVHRDKVDECGNWMISDRNEAAAEHSRSKAQRLAAIERLLAERLLQELAEETLAIEVAAAEKEDKRLDEITAQHRINIERLAEDRAMAVLESTRMDREELQQGIDHKPLVKDRGAAATEEQRMYTEAFRQGHNRGWLEHRQKACMVKRGSYEGHIDSQQREYDDLVRDQTPATIEMERLVVEALCQGLEKDQLGRDRSAAIVECQRMDNEAARHGLVQEQLDDDRKAAATEQKRIATVSLQQAQDSASLFQQCAQSQLDQEKLRQDRAKLMDWWKKAEDKLRSQGIRPSYTQSTPPTPGTRTKSVEFAQDKERTDAAVARKAATFDVAIPMNG